MKQETLTEHRDRADRLQTNARITALRMWRYCADHGNTCHLRRLALGASDIYHAIVIRNYRRSYLP